MARTLFSSRHSGNLATHVGDDPQSVQAARNALARSLSTSEIIYMEQTHSDRICEVTEDHQSIYDGDALITSRKGISLGVLVADCIPLLISSSSHIAAVHVGRQGLVKEIALKTFHAMANLGARDFSAVIGPSICAQCYEVSEEMYSDVTALIPATATSPEKHCLNLQAGLRAQLEGVGVSVRDLGICTKESLDFFSYRRDVETGRQVGVISQ